MLNNQIYPTLNLINPLHTHTHTHTNILLLPEDLVKPPAAEFGHVTFPVFLHIHKKNGWGNGMCVWWSGWWKQWYVSGWLPQPVNKEQNNVKLVQYIIYKVLCKETKTDDEMLLTLVTAEWPIIIHKLSLAFTCFKNNTINLLFSLFDLK